MLMRLEAIKKMAINEQDLDLRQLVTDQHLSEIAIEIVDWEVLAPYLGLKEAGIVEIKQDNSTYKKQKIGLLRVWRERYGDKATYQRLIQAAKDSRNAKLASHISELLGMTPSPTSSTSTPPASLHMPKKLLPADTLSTSQVTGLRSRHSDIVRDVTQLLSQKKLPSSDMVAYITSLPTEQIGEYCNFVMRPMVDTTMHPHIYQFMLKLGPYMHFMDCRLLKEMVFHFAKDFRPGLLKKMESYECDIQEFCWKTTIATFAGVRHGEEEVPKNFATLQVKHNLDPNRHTLKDLEELKKTLGQKLGCRLIPQLVECAMVFFKVELGGGTFITWLVPVEIIPDLMAAMLEPEIRKFFLSTGIVSAFIEGKPCYTQEQTSSQESDTNSDEMGRNVTPTPRSVEAQPEITVVSDRDLLDLGTLISPKSHIVKDYLDENTGVYFVDRGVFYACFVTIRPWLDLPTLSLYLTKYGVVKNADDMRALTSSYFQPQDKMNSLIKVVEEAGSDGFMFLYMCLKETSETNIGHKDAVQELDHYAKQKYFVQAHRRCSSCISNSSSFMSNTGIGGEVFTPSEYHPVCDQIEVLEKRFCSLASSALEEIIEGKVDVKQIRQHIMSLPYKLKREISYTLDQHAPEIRRKRDMDRLFIYLDTTIWNFIDYMLLEHIIRQFGSAQLRRDMERYVADLTQFCRQTTVSQLIRYWPGRSEAPTNYCPLTARINMDPDRCTVEHLNKLRKELCEQFLPQLSEFALLLWKIKKGSFIVKWFAAMDLIPDLMSTLQKQESSSFFISNSIESFEIRDIVVYPDQSQQESNTSGSDVHLSEAKITLKFESKFCHMDSNGQYPSICLNNQGWVIQVYHKETLFNLRLRYKIGFLTEGDIIWSNRFTSYDKGFWPRIAVNDAGMVIAMFCAQLGKQMFYRLGKLWYDNDLLDDTQSQAHSIPDEDTINGASIDWLGEKQLIGEGHAPSVSINNKNTVIIVYDKGRIRFRTQYRIGDIKDKVVEWRNESDSDERFIETGYSKNPSIALNDHGQVVAGYSSGIEPTVHFLAGQISSNNTSRILLGEERYSPPGVNFEPVISLNNHGHVAAVFYSFQNRLHLKNNCGIIQQDITGKTSIEWSLPNWSNFASDGYHASIAINDNRKVVTAYKSLTIHLKKSVRNKVGEMSTSD